MTLSDAALQARDLGGQVGARTAEGSHAPVESVCGTLQLGDRRRH